MDGNCPGICRLDNILCKIISSMLQFLIDSIWLDFVGWIQGQKPKKEKWNNSPREGTSRTSLKKYHVAWIVKNVAAVSKIWMWKKCHVGCVFLHDISVFQCLPCSVWHFQTQRKRRRLLADTRQSSGNLTRHFERQCVKNKSRPLFIPQWGNAQCKRVENHI